MKDLYQRDPQGCLLWCAFMFGCPGLAFLTIVIEEQTGFHLRDVEWFQSGMETIVYGAFIVGGGYVLIKILTSDDDDSDGGGGSSSLDRGAGTMSWDDSGGGGSE